MPDRPSGRGRGRVRPGIAKRAFHFTPDPALVAAPASALRHGVRNPCLGLPAQIPRRMHVAAAERPPRVPPALFEARYGHFERGSGGDQYGDVEPPVLLAPEKVFAFNYQNRRKGPAEVGNELPTFWIVTKISLSIGRSVCPSQVVPGNTSQPTGSPLGATATEDRNSENERISQCMQ